MLLEYQKYKNSKSYIEVLPIQENGGYVFIHKKADLNDIELNKRIAILLAKENGDSVIIREYFKKGKIKFG